MTSQVERLSAPARCRLRTDRVHSRSPHPDPAAAETADRGPAGHRRAARRSHRPIRRTDARSVGEPAQHRAGHAGPPDRHGYHAQPHAPPLRCRGHPPLNLVCAAYPHLPGPDRPYCAGHLPLPRHRRDRPATVSPTTSPTSPQPVPSSPSSPQTTFPPSVPPSATKSISSPAQRPPPRGSLSTPVRPSCPSRTPSLWILCGHPSGGGASCGIPLIMRPRDIRALRNGPPRAP